MVATGAAPSSQTIVVSVDGTSDQGEAVRYDVTATITPDGGWLAYLTPTAAGGDFTITAKCTAGCINTTVATIDHVTFGDVYYCKTDYQYDIPYRALSIAGPQAIHNPLIA
jgi:hypothetical protein